MSLIGPDPIVQALQRVGELLQARGEHFRIVVIGGAAMNLHGYVSRATTDVDILAFGTPAADTPAADPPAGGISRPPHPLPEALRESAGAVAREMNLSPDWLNDGPATQWELGLPDGLERRVRWRSFANLDVGLAGRLDLIFFKLYAAADDTGPGSVHVQDLLALAPAPHELEAARAWVVSQDPGLAHICQEIIAHATGAR